MFINKHLISFMRGCRQCTLLSCFLEFLLTIDGAIISLLGACAIRIALSGKPFLGFNYIYQPLMIIAVLLLVQFVLYKQKVSFANKGSRIIKTQIRQDLLNKLFELGPAYTTVSRTGEIANTISNKVEWLSNYYTLYLPAASSSIINAFFIVIALYTIDGITASMVDTVSGEPERRKTDGKRCDSGFCGGLSLYPCKQDDPDGEPDGAADQLRHHAVDRFSDAVCIRLFENGAGDAFVYQNTDVCWYDDGSCAAS